MSKVPFIVHFVHLDGRWFSMRYATQGCAIDAARAVFSTDPKISAFLSQEKKQPDSRGYVVTRIVGPERCAEHFNVDDEASLDGGVCKACEDRRTAKDPGTDAIPSMDPREFNYPHGRSPHHPWTRGVIA